MSKFKFKVSKYVKGRELESQEIIIRANEKLDAFSKIRDMFDESIYNIKFIETC